MEQRLDGTKHFVWNGCNDNSNVLYRNHPKALLDPITSEVWKTQIMVQWETMWLPFYPSKFSSDKIQCQTEKPSFYLLLPFKVTEKVTQNMTLTFEYFCCQILVCGL